MPRGNRMTKSGKKDHEGRSRSRQSGESTSDLPDPAAHIIKAITDSIKIDGDAFSGLTNPGRTGSGSAREVLEQDPGPPVIFPAAHFGVVEVLQFLADGRKTGQVRIRRGCETVVVEIEEGRITNAFSTNNPKGFRLGEILVKQGVIEDVKLLKCLIRTRDRSVKIGDALAKSNLVSETSLLHALRFQIIQSFRRCLADDEALVEFYPLGRCSAHDDFSFNLAEILLEGVVAMDRPEGILG